MAVLENTDLMLISRNDINYSISGASIKANLFPSNGLAPLVPPFAAQANTPLTLSSPSKVQYSFDQETWTSSISLALNEIVYVRWDTGINSAVQGSTYEGEITVGYTIMGTTHDVDIRIDSVNRVPDAFTLQGQTGITPGDVVTSNSVFPQTYNTPAFIWCSSNATAVEIQIANSGTWITCPTSPGDSQGYNVRVGPRQELQVRHTTPTEANTTTTTTISLGYGTAVGENQSSSFITTTDNALVDQPTITSPSNGATDIPIGDTTPITCTPFNGDGDSGVYKNTDWQLATTPDYSEIAEESLNDSTNVSTWYPTLVYGMNCYPRVRYRATDDTVSAWSPATTFTSVMYKPPLVNGTWRSTMYPYNNTSQENYPGNNGQFIVWTVPADIGRVRCEFDGAGYNMNNQGSGNFYAYGGRLVVEFDVSPGEVLRIYNCQNNHGVFINGSQTQGNCLAVVGGCGYGGSWNSGTNGNDSRTSTSGGNGGPSGTSGGSWSGSGNYGNGGGGATTSGPGAGGSAGGTRSAPGSAGGVFTGGVGGQGAKDGDNNQGVGGAGGGGWYGGGGGGATTNSGGGGGGGGSSKANATNQLITRNQTVVENVTGTNQQGYANGDNTAYGQLVIIY